MAKMSKNQDETNSPVQTDTPDVKSLQAQIDMLNELIRKTGNINKINEFDRDKNKFDGFSYSLRLFPTENGDKVVTSWKSARDFVADEGRIVDQRVKVEYDGGSEEMALVDFSRILKRSSKILATKLENLDGSEVMVDVRVNDEDNIKYNILRPKNDTYYVTLNYEGTEYKILSTYLNS